MPVILRAEDISLPWLSQVLAAEVTGFHVRAGHGNWSRQLALELDLADGTKRALRVKICPGATFGRSEVDYYTQDYIDLDGAPLVRCHDAQYEPSVGYHLLLDDLSATYGDRRDAPPTLEYGLAVADAIGRMHAHHWESQSAPARESLDRYFDEIRPGLAPLQSATGHRLRARFESHEQAFRSRWADPRGMTLLHGDLNPTNVLSPRGAELPVYFLDRQPFDWSLTYGVAVSDLAYFLVLWWPEQLRQAHEETILRTWYDAVGMRGYTWQEAQADWKLSVEQCLHVPLEWCSKPTTIDSMRWLWEAQLGRVQAAIAWQDRDAP